jgi:hypothetical protein
MARIEIMDITAVSRSFPQIFPPQVYRENILDTIDTIFEGDTQLLVIEGADGIGKTTLLTQFAKKYPNQTFSLFIKPTSRWTYDPSFLMLDLCSQINWALYQKELHELNQVDDGFLRISIFQLHRLAQKKPYFFIIDGLEDIPEEESHTREAILDMLPFGLSGFRFLLTGDLRQLSPVLPKEVPAKSFPLAKFILDETMKYLENLTNDREIIEEIHRTCRGVPGQLASIRRIVHAGTTLQQLLEDLPSNLPHLFEIEWEAIDAKDEHLHLLLAILAHSLETHTIESLGRIAQLPEERVRALLHGVGFIVISSPNDEVNFVSEAFRKFAADRLRSLREQVNAYLIDDLLRTPYTIQALTYLPEYFEQAERYEDLLEYLSPDNHFLEIVEHNQSLSPVRQRSDLGISTALKLHRDEDLMRFSIQRAIIDDFDQAEVWRSEVEARMALHDYGAALALAQRTELKEDRLHLLAVIARAKREQELPLEPELLEQMRQLYSQIAPTTLEEGKAIDVAADLIYSLPDLAIELVEKASHADTDSGSRDWAFAKLTLAAFRHDWGRFQLPDAFESVQSRIENPAARRLSHAVSFLFRKSSAQEVIVEVASFDVTERLNLLRLWARANSTRKDAIEVVETALKLMIQTTEYSPNARVLRELAVPLPHAPDITRARQLVGIFDSQKDVIENLGPTDDYVRLQLLLARTESNYDDDLETARNRFIEVYFYILDIDDLTLKTQGMARLADLLATVDSQRTLEVRDKIHTAVQNDLKGFIEQLLKTTGDHYQATRGILRVLTKTDPDQAFHLATALNIEPRRDKALADVIASAVQVPLSAINWDVITQALGHIVNQDFIDKALLSIIDELFDEETIDDLTLPHFVPLLERMGKVQDAEVRCRVCSLSFAVLKKHDVQGQYHALTSTLLDQAKTAWEAIDEGWNKVNAGFELVKVLADLSQELAKTSLDLTEAFKNTLLRETPATAATYQFCLQLAIRASCGLLSKNLLGTDERERLANYIDRVPSCAVRAGLWSDLALRHYTYHQPEDCKRIVNEQVRPLLEEMRTANVGAYKSTLSIAAPALYRAYPLTTLEQVAALPQPQRDIAYAQICSFITKKVPLSEPFDVLWSHDFRLTYDEVIELCTLLTHMEDDAMISDVIDTITASVIAGRQRGQFSRQHQQDIVEHLRRIIAIKFPSLRYIQHEGYAIIGHAQVARIERAKQEVWLTLLDKSRQIPNLTDKALVLSTLAVLMPRESSRYREVLKEAGMMVETIPVHLEKVRLYRHLASISLDIDSSLSRQYIEAAMNSSKNQTDPDLHESQRKLIDLAYRLDPDFAALMASRIDDDPAREELKQRIRILEAKRKMEQTMQPKTNDLPSIQEYAEAAWMCLGALNAGRITTVHIEHTRDFIQVASKHSLNQTYPIFAWAIENAIRRYSNTEQAKTHLRSIFLATLLGVELAEKMTTRSSVQVKRARDYNIQPPDTLSIIIQPGNREAALVILRDWFEQEVRDFLIICDAFFGPPDLEVLNLLNAINPECKVQILTSRKHQMDLRLSKPWEETYRDYWISRISDQQPPSTEIVVVGTQTKQESPVHDRWWLTAGGGFRMGTSFNSLGITKISEISRLSIQEAQSREAEIRQYLQRPFKQEFKGERLFYSTFNL